MWILIHIKQELSSGDLHIPHSAQFDDYREQLIDDETLDAELEEYAQQVELPLSEPKAFCVHLKDLLTEASRRVDERFPKNLHADIQNGRLVLRRHKAELPTSELKKLDELITQTLPQTSIIDVLTGQRVSPERSPEAIHHNPVLLWMQPGAHTDSAFHQRHQLAASSLAQPQTRNRGTTG